MADFDDFDFDLDDEGEDNDEFDFGLDDEDEEVGGDADEFGFDDDELGFDDEADLDSLDDFEDDFLEDDLGAAERGGPNRTFILIAGVMVVLFAVGLILVVVLALQPREDPLDPTRTAIAQINMTTIAEATSMAIEQMTLAFEQTQTALAPTNTPTPTPTPTEEPATATPTLSDIDLELTRQAESQALTQTAEFEAQAGDIALTQTAEALASPTPEGIGVNEVAQTATALFEVFQAQTPQAGTPTQEAGIGGQIIPTAIPDTGLFDDIASGGPGMNTIVLMALGLVGVIFLSRRLRASNE